MLNKTFHFNDCIRGFCWFLLVHRRKHSLKSEWLVVIDVVVKVKITVKPLLLPAFYEKLANTFSPFYSLMPLLLFMISVLLKFCMSLGPAASPRLFSHLFYHTDTDDIKEPEKQRGIVASCTLQ